jgi:phage terminase large subunit GpA-like protein
MCSTQAISGLLDGLRPPPRLTPGQWANEHRYMTSDISPFPGKYRLELTPYLEEPLDDLSPYSPVEEVIFKKSNQLGLTQGGNNWIGAIIHHYLGPVLMVLPTKELAERNSKLNIDSMIEASPELRARIPPARSRDSGNTTLEKKFPGGFLCICGANSPNSARSTSFRWVYLDEISAYPVNMGGEGDPYELFKGRTKAYGTKYKIFSTSTPTVDGVCRISSLYEDTDKRRYFIPCPECGEMQPLDFDRLRWEKGNYEHVWYECVNGCCIEERHKPKFMSKAAGAHWRPTDLTKLDKAKKGYHLSSLYAPLGMYSWKKIAQKHEKATGPEATPEDYQTFVNLELGETHKTSENNADYKDLIKKSVDTYEDGTAPNETAILTAGVDVQANRLEVTVRGWAAGKRSYSVDYRVLVGRPDEDAVWDELREYLEKDFKRPDGGVMNISYTCVDSGYLANRVYQFCSDFGSGRCAAVKGSDTQKTVVSQPKPVNINRLGKKVGNGMIYLLGVDQIKETIYSRLKLDVNYETGEVPTGYCYFPKTRDVYYFQGLCSEVRVVINGKRIWKKKVLRNEPLDLEVYAYAAAELAGVFRKTDEWFMSEIVKFAPDRQRFTAKSGRQRRKSDYWDKLG